MGYTRDVTGLLALLFATAAWPQGAPPSGHHAGTREAVQGKASPPAPIRETRPPKAYRSAFEGYRPFTPDEPLKDWRAANDEVREAGGHVGLMKGAPGGATGHAGHAAEGKKGGK